ncbi:hypothetical protein HZS55_01540 [Halosimplex rubrum]|uniref:Uncharacterized protein n=1 Tax=Halosimplex rubrum TaxID=869889 RepID=A0A7D5NXZ3_9EURY|nr:hypothetical protein [Halosimplex rubrum]QLH76066.1 hypothetical protein HZS55_01540 [Halosimplex rubrum]
MGRTIEVSGGSLRFTLYALQLGALAAVLLFVVSPFDSAAGVPLALLFGALGIATVYGLWRRRTDSGCSPQARTAEDITYDPIADPGQAARHRWEKTVRRLPGGDDED